MQGTLSEFTLVELLQLFAFAERTGIISVSIPTRKNRILLESGRVVGIGHEDFDVHREIMACELLPARSGAALDSITPVPATPGLSFVVRNLIEPERWELFTRRCFEQEIYPLLTAESGTFDISVERIPYCPLAVTVSVQQLVLDGSRWEAEMAEHRQDGFGLQSIWKRASAFPASIEMTSIEWLTWAILTESRSIQDAARRLCVPDIDVTAAVRELQSHGVLELAG